MPFLMLFMAMLALMLMRVHLPVGGARYSGRPLTTVSLSFSERLHMQRVNTYAIGLVLLLTTVTGTLPSGLAIPIVLIATGILFIPVRCTITTEGVGINNVVFRPWNELSGFATERRRIRLIGREGTRPFMLPLLPGKQQDVLPVLRRYLKPAESPTGGTSRVFAVAKSIGRQN